MAKNDAKKFLQLSVKVTAPLRKEFLVAVAEAEGLGDMDPQEIQRRATDCMRASLLRFARSSVTERREWIRLARVYDLDLLDQAGKKSKS